MDNGWIKLHRKILTNAIITKPEYFTLFCILVLSANHQDKELIVNGKKTLVKRGQILTSRLKLSQISLIQESKVERILKYLKNEQQIEQQNLITSRLITIINYEQYQSSEQQNEQQMNTERTPNEHRMNTNNNDKNYKNDKNIMCSKFTPPTIEEIKEYITKNNYSVDPDTFYNYFSISNWIDSNGKKVKNWKQKIITWHGRNGNKVKKSTARMYTPEEMKEFDKLFEGVKK